ncbi:unnamed protein product [Amoebophrya sp. A25]|nr:unnamed protein product [Amoebophrya sp. A25]|eukprot:GSA25T00026945001.1
MSRAKKGQELEPAIAAEAFDQLGKDFQELMEELSGDQALEAFRVEYEKLHAELVRSHDSEKKLIGKCKALNQEIVQNALKVQTALKLSHEDQKRITALKKEVERAWRTVETQKEKETRATESIQVLKGEADKLSRIVEQGAAKSVNQEQVTIELSQDKVDLTKTRDLLQTQVNNLQFGKMEFQEKTERAQLELQNQGAEVLRLQQEMARRRAAGEDEQKRKHELNEELQTVRVKIDETTKEINGNKLSLDEQKAAMQGLEARVKAESDKVGEGYNKQNKLEDEIKKRRKLTGEEQMMCAKLREEAAKHESSIEEINRERSYFRRKRKAAEEECNELEAFRRQLAEDRKVEEGIIAELKAEVAGLKQDVAACQKQADNDQKYTSDITRERDILTKNVSQGDDRSKKQIEMVTAHERMAEELEKEVLTWKLTMQNTNQRIEHLDGMKDKHQRELQEAYQKYNQGQETVVAREATVAELNVDLGDIKQKLHQQKGLYEQVRTDRNLYAKNLAEAQEEIGTMKERFRNMYHQIETLRDEIRTRDSDLIKKHCDHVKVSKEMDRVKDHLEKTKKRQNQLQHITELQHREMKKIEATIANAELERLGQKKELSSISTQRNILATQLIKRNEELSLLYEKIRVQQSTLQKGEAHFRKRQEELAKLRAEIRRIQAMNRAASSASKVGELSKEANNLERELFAEKHKVKALAEELSNPMNVHRWRKLEGSDPQVFNLINKIKTLQQRIISKTELVIDKGESLKRRDKAYTDLRKVLSRQPGPEIADSLALYQEHVKKKKSQCEKMTGELQVYQGKVSELREELQRVHRANVDVRKKLYEQRRKEKTVEKKVIHTLLPQLPRFTGGGFNLSL